MINKRIISQNSEESVTVKLSTSSVTCTNQSL